MFTRNITDNKEVPTLKQSSITQAKRGTYRSWCFLREAKGVMIRALDFSLTGDWCHVLQQSTLMVSFSTQEHK